MPEEHTVCVLVLINRLCTMAQQNFERIYVRAKNDRILSQGSRKPVTINSQTVHRLILVVVLVVHKYYTDPFYLNSDISKIGGLPLKDLNDLEEEFLDIIDFNLSVDECEYEEYVNGLNDYYSRPLSNETI